MKIFSFPLLAQAALQIKTTIIHPGRPLSSEQHKLLEKYSQLRTDYALQENWPVDKNALDIDIYDAPGKSSYIVAHSGERLIAGIRITPIAAINQSLSMSMWQQAHEKQLFQSQLAEHHALLTSHENKELYDVTRLLSYTSLNGTYTSRAKAQSRIGILKVMSASVAAGSLTSNAVWVFTISRKMLKFMKRNHIDVHLLASAKIGVDDDLASLCVVYPRIILNDLKRRSKIRYSLSMSVIRRHGNLQ